MRCQSGDAPGYFAGVGASTCRNSSLALIALAALAAGCGKSDHPPAPEPPFQAVALVRAFVTQATVASRDCPRMWKRSRQATCRQALAVIRRARAEGALADVTRDDYHLMGVSGSTATVDAGVRQPQPGEGALPFYASFDVVRVGDSWRIAAVRP